MSTQSNEDKVRIQTFCEQEIAAKLVKAYFILTKTRA